MMTRFMRDWNGDFGEYWQNDARKQVAMMMEKYRNGECVVDSDGAVRWASNGRYLFQDLTEMLMLGGAPVSVEATGRSRSRQVDEWLGEYRERMADYQPSAEEMAEMRNAFGEGEVVVDVITGREYRL